jgi:endonuclease YncB( thermonuclease family)
MPGCAEGAGTVVSISEGDTTTVLAGRPPPGVRLRGIDAAETSQDYGRRAKQVASDLAFGKIVTVRTVE